MTHNTIITKDLDNKKLHVTREFSGSLAKVWAAWTEAELLDKWWAPKPWKAETKTIDFTTGGVWHYAMVGPNSEKHWSWVDLKTVVPQKEFTSECRFCDENGKYDENFPPMYWHVEFMESSVGTKIEVELSFDTLEGLEKIVAMGFEGGFTMGLGNLDELLAE